MKPRDQFFGLIACAAWGVALGSLAARLLVGGRDVSPIEAVVLAVAIVVISRMWPGQKR